MAGHVPLKAWMTLAASVVMVLALAPVAFVGWMTLEAGWRAVATLVFRARVAELLVNTAALIVLTLFVCALVSIALAWLVERSDLPGRGWFAWLAVAPLAIPAFVHSYAWVGVFPGLGGLGAGVLVSTLAYFPFMYLPVAAALRRLDPELDEVAASMGLGPWHVFVRVVLPQLRLALCGGGLLVGLHLLAEYGLYVMIRFDTFTTAIVDQFQASYDGIAAIMLAAVLIVSCAGLLLIEAQIRGDHQYARIGGGALRRRAPARLGRATVPCLLAATAVIALALGVPLLTLGGWLWRGGAAAWADKDLVPALFETLALALAGALLTSAAAFPAAWLSQREQGPLPRAIEAAGYFVGAIPGVIVALALVAITVRAARPLYQTATTLLLAYAIMFLPRAVVGLRASIAQVPRRLEEAAASLGRPPTRALWEITLRLAAPGVASAMALVGLGITNELTATIMLAPNGTRTLATQFWAYSSEIDYAAAAPYALLMILLSAPMTHLLQRQRVQTRAP